VINGQITAEVYVGLFVGQALANLERGAILGFSLPQLVQTGQQGYQVVVDDGR
jgi:hypothetical protein